MSDALRLAFIALAAPFAVIAFVSWLLHYFVALNSPPTRRAAWIVGIGYLVATAFCLTAVPSNWRWEVPFAAIPGALLVFWFWRGDFRRAWIDDAQGIPEGVELANSDWRIGLIAIAGMFVYAAYKVLFRYIASGQ